MYFASRKSVQWPDRSSDAEPHAVYLPPTVPPSSRSIVHDRGRRGQGRRAALGTPLGTRPQVVAADAAAAWADAALTPVIHHIAGRVVVVTTTSRLKTGSG